VSRNDANTSLWLLKFVLVLFQIFYLVVIILVHICGENVLGKSSMNHTCCCCSMVMFVFVYIWTNDKVKSLPFSRTYLCNLLVA